MNLINHLKGGGGGGDSTDQELGLSGVGASGGIGAAQVVGVGIQCRGVLFC